MPVDPSKREKYLEYLAKEYDGDIPIFEQGGPVGRIPFKSPMLTWATTGGMPIGHWGRWYGPESSGKSLTNLGLLWGAQRFPEIVSERYEREIKFFEANNLKMRAIARKKKMEKLVKMFPDGMSAIIFDTEQRWDEVFARRMGVNPNKVVIEDQNIIEYIIRDIKAALEAFHIVIIDSASNAQSLAEDELLPEKELRGSGPRAWSRLKQIRKRFDRRENTLIIVDQMRTQLGQVNFKGQANVTPPAIRIIRHNASMTMEFSGGKWLYLDKNMILTDDRDKASNNINTLGTDGKEPHGIEMQCKIMKNSTGRPFRNARMRFRFPVAETRTGELMQDVGFDQPFELLEIGLYFEIIGKSGKWFYPLSKKFKPGKTKWDGEAKARAGIANSEELQDRILTRIVQDI